MIRKFATATLMDAEIAPKNGRLPSLWKAGHRVTFDYRPRPGYLYVRSRMISSRCNDNFDEFPAHEIIGNAQQHIASAGDRTGYLTFLGKPVFVNHQNANHRRARGVITRVALHEDFNADRSPDTWAEGLMEVDAVSYPKLALAVVRGDIDRTSMGVDVAMSKCSACGNEATTPLEYCRHIPGMKGRRYAAFDRSAPGGRTSNLIRETCHGLRFFENSLLVEAPADPTAFTLGNVELGAGLEHLSKSASRSSNPSVVLAPSLTQPTQRQHIVSRSSVPTVDSAPAIGRPTREEDRTTLHLVAGRICIECRSIQTVANRVGDTECLDCGAAFHATALVREAAGAVKYPDPSDHPWFQTNPVHHDNIVNHWRDATPDEKTSGKNWYSDAHIIATALGEHHEKIHGPHPHGAAHIGAGIIAQYSPQMGWAGNMHNAARVLSEGKGIGGKGSGMFASEQQRKGADRMLAGERHEDVLGGPKIQDFAHLIEHGGDRDPQDPRTVIDRHALSVATGRRMSNDDYAGFPKGHRHYYGHVVKQYDEAAKRITEDEGEHVSAHQVQATTWLVRQRKNQTEEANEQDTNRQRLNKGRENNRAKEEQGWEEFRQNNYPDLPHSGPGSGYQKKTSSPGKAGSLAGRRGGHPVVHTENLATPTSIHSVAYGETKAPPVVDTLRDENCPVCGETTAAWNGDECSVCGFVQPPKQFRDPDLDKARQVDLRKNDGDLGATDVSDLEAQTNDRDRDGLDDMTGEPVNEEEQEGAFDEQPLLVCPNCETEFPAAEPQTINTRDPQAGSDSLGGPEAGDVCPACGKAQLVTGQELDELMGAEEPTNGEMPTDDEGNPVEESEEDPDLPFGRPDSSGTDDETEEQDPDEESEEDEGDPEESNRPVNRKGSPFNR